MSITTKTYQNQITESRYATLGSEADHHLRMEEIENSLDEFRLQE